MAGKITDYLNETNEVGILDLLDISKEIGGSFQSKRFKRDSTDNELKFSGGATIFIGEDAITGNYSLRARNSDNTQELSLENDGVFLSGKVDASNYIRQELQRTVQFSNTAASTGFIADNNGAKLATRSGTSAQYLQYTDKLNITHYGGSETGANILDTLMLFDGASIYFGNDTGTGKSLLQLVYQRLGDSTSTATQTDSAANIWINGLWNGSANVVESFKLEAEASSAVNQETTWQLSHEGTDIFGVRNDGVVLMTSLPTSAAGLPSGALWNNSNVLNIV